MKSKVRLLGKAIPVWLLVFALVTMGAGAAVGTVLAGEITGKAPVTVSQALTLRSAPTNPSAHPADEFIGTRSDDGTAFTAAAEVDTGDKYRINLDLKNASDKDLVGKLTLEFPDRISIDVVASSLSE